jgi:hypothetical protein
MHSTSFIWLSRHVSFDYQVHGQRYEHGSRTTAKRQERFSPSWRLTSPVSLPLGCFSLTCCSVGCFFPVLVEASLCAIPTIQALLQGIVDVHLNRALSLQEKEEPPLQTQDPKPNQEESQDEYGQFDLNWDDPMVLEALNNAAEPAAVAAPVPTTMQYTYQSLIEVGLSILIPLD